VDAELVAVPGLGTLTTRGLAGGDLEVLGRETDGALDGEALAAGTLNELGADLLKRLDLSAGQGDADAVALLLEGLASWPSDRIRCRSAVCQRTGASPTSFSFFW
jgi:hypothetical protein